ncbi:MAG: hypothetical protein WCV62_02345 [Candidatus Peribacteraceae bacterium]|jgi:hypothetical protein
MITTLCILIPSPPRTQAAVATFWNREVAIIIQESKIDATLTNFPVLLTEENLPSEPCDADGSYPAQDGGGDIRFTTDADGNNQIPLEIVTFATNNNPALCDVEMYVKVPSISSSTGTYLYMWYNTGETNEQPAASSTYGSEYVWSSYAAVWHMNEASGTRYDSTANNNDLTDVNTVTATGGKIGANAASFDDANSEYLYISDNASLSMGADVNMNMSAWTRMHDKSTYHTIASKYATTSGAREYVLSYSSSDDRFYAMTMLDAGGSSAGSLLANNFGSPSVGTWTHVAMRFDAPSNQMDIGINNGTRNSQNATGDIYNGTARFVVGAGNTEGSILDLMDGDIDEVRVIKQSISDAWWKAEYENLYDPAAFAVEQVPEDGSIAPLESTVRKSADQSVTSSTTLQNDTHFLFTLEANKSYVLTGGIFATSTSATPDIKIGFSLPLGTTMDIGYIAQGGNNRVADLLQTSDTASSLIPIPANGHTIIQSFGTIVTGGTGGTLRFKWSQNTSNATATTVKEGSFISISEITE